MNEVKSEISQYALLMKLTGLFQRINQASWTANDAKKRYPAPEAMTNQEVEQLTKFYITWLEEIKEITKEVNKVLKEK